MVAALSHTQTCAAIRMTWLQITTSTLSWTGYPGSPKVNGEPCTPLLPVARA
jgi:hypothetical protein